MEDSVGAKVRAFVIQNFMFGEGGQFTDSESFLEAGIVDSTGVLELVGFLEATFGIIVADEELVPANLDSVDNVVGFVQRKLGDRGVPLAG